MSRFAILVFAALTGSALAQDAAPPKLEPLPEGFLYLGFIFARGDSAETVESALRAAYSRIDVVMEGI